MFGQDLARAPIQVRHRRVERDRHLQVAEALERCRRRAPVRCMRARPFPERAPPWYGTRSTRGGLPGLTSMTTKLFSSSTSPKSSCIGEPGVLGVRTGGLDTLRPVDVPKRDVLRRRRQRLRASPPTRRPCVTTRSEPQPFAPAMCECATTRFTASCRKPSARCARIRCIASAYCCLRQRLVARERQRLDDAPGRGPRHGGNTGDVSRPSRHLDEPALRAATGQAARLHADELRQQAPRVHPHRVIVIAGHDDRRDVGASQPLEEAWRPRARPPAAGIWLSNTSPDISTRSMRSRSMKSPRCSRTSCSSDSRFWLFQSRPACQSEVWTMRIRGPSGRTDRGPTALAAPLRPAASPRTGTGTASRIAIGNLRLRDDHRAGPQQRGAHAADRA